MMALEEHVITREIAKKRTALHGSIIKKDAQCDLARVYRMHWYESEDDH